MASEPLTATQLEGALAALPDWQVTDGNLTAAFTAQRARVPALYEAVAAAEDEANHHAAVRILYGTVSFALNTHDAGGAITERDTALAARISALCAEHGARPVT